MTGRDHRDPLTETLPGMFPSFSTGEREDLNKNGIVQRGESPDQEKEEEETTEGG